MALRQEALGGRRTVLEEAKEMIRGDLEGALLAAGFLPGERFELAYLTEDRKMRSRLFTDTERAFAWIEKPANLNCDCYLGLSPLHADADPPHGRARECDVLVARTLLVDCDPVKDLELGTARAASGVLAARVAELLRDKGFDFATIDSGRGRQLWLRHETTEPGNDLLSWRAKFLKALAASVRVEGAYVENDVYDLNRLARLPGTRNSRSGLFSCIVSDLPSFIQAPALVLADLPAF